MGVEVIKMCDYDRVIFNYFFFLFRPISPVFFGLHFLKVDIWSWAEQENGYISLSEGGASVFIGRALHFSFCLITKARFKRIAINTHIPLRNFAAASE